MNLTYAISMADGHAAPLGLVIDGGTMGYKQAAPTELLTPAEEAKP